MMMAPLLYSLFLVTPQSPLNQPTGPGSSCPNLPLFRDPFGKPKPAFGRPHQRRHLPFNR